MSEYRGQHYVPQSYLKRFTTDGKSLYVFDKQLKKSFPNGVGNCAKENGFFDVQMESPDGTRQMVEKGLVTPFESRCENAVKALLKSAERHRTFDIGRKAKRAVGCAIAFQFIRTREFRNSVLKGAATALAHASGQDRARCIQATALAILTFGKVMARTLPERGSENPIVAQSTSLEHADILFSGAFKLARLAAEVLEKYFWVILDTEFDNPFYTSDAPVILWRPNDLNTFHLGMGSPGAEIAFPMSSRHILVLTQASEAKCHEGHVYHIREEGARQYNALQVCTAYRWIYRSQNDFGLAAEMISREPALSDIDSPRHRVHFQPVHIFSRGT